MVQSKILTLQILSKRCLKLEIRGELLRKERRMYYFSVEGSTEKWYLDWLQRTINADPQSRYVVKIESKVDKNPLSYVKRLSIITPILITHLFDYESRNPEHARQFQSTMDLMQAAKRTGKRITYRLGYSNYTFELWMVLHKSDFNVSLSHRSQYLRYINQAYDENFISLDAYKREDNFNRILDGLTLSHVRDAICRAKAITERNASNFKVHEYKGYKYFDENPSLSLWEAIEEILEQCNLI